MCHLSEESHKTQDWGGDPRWRPLAASPGMLTIRVVSRECGESQDSGDGGVKLQRVEV